MHLKDMSGRCNYRQDRTMLKKEGKKQIRWPGVRATEGVNALDVLRFARSSPAGCQWLSCLESATGDSFEMDIVHAPWDKRIERVEGWWVRGRWDASYRKAATNCLFATVACLAGCCVVKCRVKQGGEGGRLR